MDNFANFLNGGCYICNKRQGVICNRCFDSLIPISKRPSSDISLYRYNEVASKILLMSKYPPYNFFILKHLIRRSILDFSFSSDTLLCPIPISSLKMFERKFNQADLISTEFAKKLGLNSHEILVRKTDTKPLFSLGKRQRELELEGIFRPTRVGKFLVYKFQNIVLVDDLRTTGETLRQAKQALTTVGYKNVKSLTLFTT
jgi:competence protein ComFC